MDLSLTSGKTWFYRPGNAKLCILQVAARNLSPVGVILYRNSDLHEWVFAFMLQILSQFHYLYCIISSRYSGQKLRKPLVPKIAVLACNVFIKMENISIITFLWKDHDEVCFWARVIYLFHNLAQSIFNNTLRFRSQIYPEQIVSIFQ